MVRAVEFLSGCDILTDTPCSGQATVLYSYSIFQLSYGVGGGREDTRPYRKTVRIKSRLVFLGWRRTDCVYGTIEWLYPSFVEARCQQTGHRGMKRLKVAPALSKKIQRLKRTPAPARGLAHAICIANNMFSLWLCWRCGMMEIMVGSSPSPPLDR